MKACRDAGKAAVVGTTGWEPGQVEEVKALAGQVPLVFASNMSVGMNLMFKLVKQMAEVLGPDYALELLEAHHDQKKDAPSGTAVTLLDQLRAARGWHGKDVFAHGRKGLVGGPPRRGNRGFGHPGGRHRGRPHRVLHRPGRTAGADPPGPQPGHLCQRARSAPLFGWRTRSPACIACRDVLGL